MSPKINKNHMFPKKCIQPPCRNMDVKIVIQAGNTASSAGRLLLSNSTEGITPNEYTASWTLSPRESCQINTSMQAASTR